MKTFVKIFVVCLGLMGTLQAMKEAVSADNKSEMKAVESKIGTTMTKIDDFVDQLKAAEDNSELKDVLDSVKREFGY